MFLPSNLFAKTDPGCPATTAMFQQKHVPQKHVSITAARHSPHPSSPRPFATNTALWTIPKSPLTNPSGFHCPQPSELMFRPQIFLPKPIPDVLLPRQCFSKNMCRKNMSA